MNCKLQIRLVDVRDQYKDLKHANITLHFSGPASQPENSCTFYNEIDTHNACSD